MPTSFANANSLILSRVIANQVSGVQFAYDNKDETKIREDRTQEVWARVSIFEDTSVVAGLSGGSWRQYRNLGTIVVACFSQEAIGTKAVLDLADSIAAIFRGVSHDGITYRAPSAVRVGPAGGWYQVNVTIPFFWDLLQ